MNWFDDLWSKVESNCFWSEWVYYIDGWLPKVSLSMPIFGYLILFNDESVALINFNIIANENIINSGLSGNDRLKMIYFAFLFLGVSNFWYRIKKPFQFKFGTNFVQYQKNALEVFTIGKYLDIHVDIQKHGHHISSTEYYTSEWNGFVEAATNTGEGTENVKRDGDWEKAKSQYGSMLRGMLEEYYFLSNTSRRVHLSICVICSSMGYALLLIPSIDLLAKILRTIF